MYNCRKSFFIVMLLTYTSMLSGCYSQKNLSGNIDKLFTSNNIEDSSDVYIRSKRMEYGNSNGDVEKIRDILLESIKSENVNTIKRLFTDDVIEENVDIDSQIKSMFEYIEGDIISTDYIIGSEYTDKLDSGYRIMETSTDYTINTTKDIYLVTVDYTEVDEENPEREGMHQITVMTQNMFDEQNYGPFDLSKAVFIAKKKQ